jgi:hypothetical protein
MITSNQRTFGKIIVALLIAFLFFGCVTTKGDLFERVVASDTTDSERRDNENGGSKKPDMGDTEPTNGEKPSETEDKPVIKPEQKDGISINTAPEGASVYIDGDYAGRTPILLDVDAGNYDIAIRMIGYYPEIYKITYVEGEYQVIDATLTEITGYLYIATEPTDADITIGGSSASTGVTELRVGSYPVTIRAFGYEPYATQVDIREKQTTEISIALEAAELELSDLSATRKVLNPRNPGRLGEVVFTFDVTTYGSGTASIFNEEDQIIRKIGLPRFTSWSQQFRWTGTDSDGRFAEDGTYRIVVSANDENGTIDEIGPIYLLVSSEAVITYRSGWSGIAGTLYAPSAELLPLSSFQVSILGAGTVTDSAGRVPIQAFVRFPATKGLEIAVQGGVILNSSGSTPLSTGVSAKLDIFGSANGTAPVGVAAYAVATLLLRTTADSQTNFSGGRAGIVGTFRGGPLRLSGAIELAGAPYPVSYDPESEWGTAALFSYGRLGASLEFEGFSAGISGAVRTYPFSEGFGIQLPFAAGAEVHWLIPGTYLELSAVAFTEFENMSSLYPAFGGGIGIVY